MTPATVPERDGVVSLRWWHIEILRVLDEQNGFAAGTIGRAVWKSMSPRQAASSATPGLKVLEKKGLATRLDDKSPTIWLRTPAGSEVLARALSIPVREIER